MTQADIVVVHFWNNPALYEFLRDELPAMHLVIWLKIFGGHAPQVVPRSLHGFADTIVAASPGTLSLPGFVEQQRDLPMVYGIADFERLNAFSRQAHTGFNVGYIGAVSPAKIHPAFVAMSAAVNLPAARFIVCGTGGEQSLAQQAQAIGAAERFEFRGYVENIRVELERFDVFGYPLCAETYAASEKALQEAMWVGIPPVVFPYGGIRYLVQDGVTGLVVHSEQAYTRAIERLYHAPAERRRLGANAREYARATFDPLRAVRQFDAVYATLMQQPKRTLRWPDDGKTPAEWFVAALGDQGAPFARSLQGNDPGAEAEIAQASDLLFSGEGGIVHYRNTYPDDPYLRFWTGLTLCQRGQIERAQSECAAATALGLAR
ncbi:MAG: glycosyltransferase family 4 protein [Chloroflexi bacterium]|nr:glycosyltransferase family 4 protein [Chloroflexota bacterium]MBU1746981.1 glycosyltransferase family 4 protein [Chloroflexota bacterium]